MSAQSSFGRCLLPGALIGCCVGLYDCRGRGEDCPVPAAP